MLNVMILKFFKAHGPYVVGDVAGFSPEQAEKLKSVARAYDPEEQEALEKLIIEADTSKVQEMIDSATAEFAEKDADLKAREAALVEREKKLAEAEAAASETPEDDAKNSKKAKGDPPAQGTKAAAKD